MNPSHFDESLLTAYLDGELTESERRMVEAQLERNREWRQLLNELDNVRQLIRQLPTPPLSRTITTGPWNQTTSTAKESIEPAMATTSQTPRRAKLVLGRLALAASIMVCALGAFAWMRLQLENEQVAVLTPERRDESRLLKTEQVGRPALESESMVGGALLPDTQESGKSARPTNPPIERKDGLVADKVGSDFTPSLEKTASASGSGREELLLAQTESEARTESRLARGMAEQQAGRSALKGSIPAPTPSLAAVPSEPASMTAKQEDTQRARELSRGFRTAESKDTDELGLAKERVATLFAKPSQAVESTSKQLDAIAEIAADKKQAAPVDAFILAPDLTASTQRYYWGALNPSAGSLPRSLDANQRYEFYFPPSALESVLTVVRAWGYEVSLAELTAAESNERLLSDRDQEKAKTDSNSLQRPPVLTGAIDEPADWMRIVIESSSKN